MRCKNCGKEFEPHDHRQLFCLPMCKNKYYCRRYYKSLPDDVRARYNERKALYYAENRETILIKRYMRGLESPVLTEFDYQCIAALG